MSWPDRATRTTNGFRLLGIPVEVPWGGLFGVVLLAYLWAPSFDSATLGVSKWVLAGIFALLLSMATLIHEFAHALVARAMGYPVQRVVLQLMGGVTYFNRVRKSPWREAAIAASGPMATFTLVMVAASVASFAPPGSATWTLARAFMWANILIGIYNSLPGLPLDGGTVLRSVVWAVSGSERTGTIAAAWVGRGVAVMTFAAPFVLTAVLDLKPDPIFYILGGILAAVLFQGANHQLRSSQMRERASDLSAAGLARRAIPVGRDLPLAEGIRRAAAAGASAMVVTGVDGLPTAIGHAEAINAVPEGRRPWVSVGSVSRTIDQTSLLAQDLVGDDLLRAVISGGRSEYLVVDPAGLVFGVLSTADVQAGLAG